MKIFAGLRLGLLVGAGCRWFDIPVPSPPKLVGALLVVAMTVGYITTESLITRKFTGRGPATTKPYAADRPDRLPRKVIRRIRQPVRGCRSVCRSLSETGIGGADSRQGDSVEGVQPVAAAARAYVPHST